MTKLEWRAADALRERGLLDVAQDIARGLHITLDELFSWRMRPAPEGRAKFYAYLWSLGWSYPAIGKLVRRDHSTIMAALRQP